MAVAAAAAVVAQAVHTLRPTHSVLEKKGNKPITPDEVDTFLLRVTANFVAIDLPDDQWVRHACTLLRDAPAELWWETQVNAGRAAEPPTRPHVTMNWEQFKAALRAVYMRNDYVPSLLHQLDTLKCEGEHDISNFCEKFEKKTLCRQEIKIYSCATLCQKR